MNAVSMPNLLAIDRPDHIQLIAKIEFLHQTDPDHPIIAIRLGFSHHTERLESMT